MTLVEHLLAMVEAVPPGGAVTLPRDWLAVLLDAQPPDAETTSPPVQDEMLTAAQVAARLNVTRRWVFDHRDVLGGKQLSRRCVRFPDSAVRRYFERRR